MNMKRFLKGFAVAGIMYGAGFGSAELLELFSIHWMIEVPIHLAVLIGVLYLVSITVDKLKW